jgi:predicted nucleotidyltransferase component of viral defense system
MLNVYKIAEEYASDIMEEQEHWSEDDLYDITHEHADGSEHVIYYHAAHEFVQALPFDVKNDAEQEVADCGMINENTRYDSLATLIAYFALKMLILDAVDKRLESVRTPSYA